VSRVAQDARERASHAGIVVDEVDTRARLSQVFSPNSY
jgi:hypothetical protein